VALPTTLGRSGFPTMTRTFRRCNADHRINVWDDSPEAWTGLRRLYSGGVSASADGPDRGGAPVDAVAGPTRPGFLRRLGAFVVDWVIAVLVTFLVLPYDLYTGQGPPPDLVLGVPESSWAVLGVFGVMTAALVMLAGSTVGHRLFSLQVWQVRPGFFPLQVLVRTALACLFLPALIVLADGRGLHDLAAGTRLVRLPR
jgi:uncharacterized RDD family membrane protein YckC